MKDGRLKLPLKLYSTPAFLFEQRVMPFSFLPSPPVLQYQQYEDSIHTENSSDELFLAASHRFKIALKNLQSVKKSHSDHLPSPEVLKQLAQIAIANSVNILKRSKDSATRIKFNFTHGEAFPIVSL